MNLEKMLLQYYFNNPKRLLVCQLEPEDFAEFGFVYSSLKDHVSDNGDIDVSLYSAENTSAFLALDLHEYSVPLSEKAEAKIINTLREKRLNNIVAGTKKVKDLDRIEALRKPLQIEKTVSLKEGINDYWSDFVEIAERRKATGTVGLPVGVSLFNEHPLIPNTLVVLGARTSIGKTAVALNMAYGLAKNGGKVLYMTAEMDYNSVLSRLYALATDHPVSSFIHAKDDKLVSDAFDSVQTLLGDVHLKYCGGWTWEKIKEYILSTDNYDMVVLDHLHYLPVKDNEVQFLTEVINEAKMIAGQKRNTFLMLAQVNRAVGDSSQEPEVYHLRGSGGIEQGADMVVMLHRPDRADPQGVITLAKNRGGANGDKYEIYLDRKTLKLK